MTYLTEHPYLLQARTSTYFTLFIFFTDIGRISSSLINIALNVSSSEKPGKERFILGLTGIHGALFCFV